jgi:hypothetical protein
MALEPLIPEIDEEHAAVAAMSHRIQLDKLEFISINLQMSENSRET